MVFRKHILPLIFLLCAVFIGEFSLNAQTPRAVPKGEDSLTLFDSADLVFMKVDIDAAYPSGEKVWQNFIGNNLNPGVPLKKKAPAGVYTVIVQFVVDTKGYLTDFKPLTNFGYGMEDEVIRVLKLSSRWKPAIQNDKPVQAYRKQPVTFVIEEKGKKRG